MKAISRSRLPSGVKVILVLLAIFVALKLIGFVAGEALSEAIGLQVPAEELARATDTERAQLQHDAHLRRLGLQRLIETFGLKPVVEILKFPRPWHEEPEL